MPGQWQHSTRSKRLGPGWHARRAACYRDAGGRCQHTDPDGNRCTSQPPLHKTPTDPAGQADHVDRAEGETGELAWLCVPHHREKTTREGTAALPRERRTPEPHPGLA